MIRCNALAASPALATKHTDLTERPTARPYTRHPICILDLYTQSLAPTGRGYEQISSGTCASSGLVTITEKAECEKAVKALGRTVTLTLIPTLTLTLTLTLTQP